MAKKRDIIIAVIIIGVFLVSFVFFGLMFIGLMAPDSDFEISGVGGNIGVIQVYGTIDEYTGRKAIRQIDKWSESGSIKALVIHVNSPGGGAAISQELHDAIKRYREETEKPVITSMASMAASGGYYIACASDRIMANPGTLTGSIGVVLQFYTAEKLMDKVGVGLETVKSGDLKDVGNWSRSMTEKEEMMLHSVVMDTYEQFVEVVAEGRGKDVEEIYPLADGSIYTGLQAYNLGLVDELGGLDDALELAKELAEIDGEAKAVYPYERKKVSIFDVLGNFGGLLERPLSDVMSGPQLMYLYK